MILCAESRLPNVGRFLAENFRHRESLHSYCLPTESPSPEHLEEYVRERDQLRAQDLFHPIWTPYRKGMRRTSC